MILGCWGGGIARRRLVRNGFACVPGLRRPRVPPPTGPMMDPVSCVLRQKGDTWSSVRIYIYIHGTGAFSHLKLEALLGGASTIAVYCTLQSDGRLGGRDSIGLMGQPLIFSGLSGRCLHARIDLIVIGKQVNSLALCLNRNPDRTVVLVSDYRRVVRTCG